MYKGILTRFSCKLEPFLWVLKVSQSLSSLKFWFNHEQNSEGLAEKCLLQASAQHPAETFCKGICCFFLRLKCTWRHQSFACLNDLKTPSPVVRGQLFSWRCDGITAETSQVWRAHKMHGQVQWAEWSGDLQQWPLLPGTVEGLRALNSSKGKLMFLLLVD